MDLEAGTGRDVHTITEQKNWLIMTIIDVPYDETRSCVPICDIHYGDEDAEVFETVPKQSREIIRIHIKQPRSWHVGAG
jgi:hypothetical protein